VPGPRRIAICIHSLTDGKARGGDGSGFVGRRRSLPVERLESTLAWLSGFSRFVTLDELIDGPAVMKGRPWQVAITLDDGYADNITLGLPLFERFEAPVTWFVATRFVEQRDRLPWWDLVELAVERCKGSLEWESAGKTWRHDLGERSGREMFRDAQSRAFLGLTGADRDRHQQALEQALGARLPLPANGFASLQDLSRAAESRWLQLGAHTASHINMAVSPENELRDELEECASKLRSWTGQEIRWFAYPFGEARHRDARALAAVREAGFAGAVTLDGGFVTPSSSRWELPRNNIWAGWDLRQIRRRLRGAELYRIARLARTTLTRRRSAEGYR